MVVGLQLGWSLIEIFVLGGVTTAASWERRPFCLVLLDSCQDEMQRIVWFFSYRSCGTTVRYVGIAYGVICGPDLPFTVNAGWFNRAIKHVCFVRTKPVPRFWCNFFSGGRGMVWVRIRGIYTDVRKGDDYGKPPESWKNQSNRSLVFCKDGERSLCLVLKSRLVAIASVQIKTTGAYISNIGGCVFGSSVRVTPSGYGEISPMGNAKLIKSSDSLSLRVSIQYVLGRPAV